MVVPYSTELLPDELLPIIDNLNAGNHRLPWLDNRRLVMALTPPREARAGP